MLELIANMTRERVYYFLRYWIPVILWAMLIFTFSASATPKTSEFYWQDFVVKKTAHVIEYSVFTIFLFRAFRTTKLGTKQNLIYTFLLVAFYAVADEIHQSFTPGREPTLRDVLIDCGASLFTLGALKFYLHKTPEFVKRFAKRLELL